MSVYVINLDKSVSRWEQIQQDWKGVFNLVRVQAEEDPAGWKGCGRSHVKIVEQAKARGDPFVLVWEDDCIPKLRNNEHTQPFVIRALWDSVVNVLVNHLDKWDIVLGATSRVFEGSVLDRTLSNNVVKLFRITHGFTTHWTFYNASVYDRIIAWKGSESEPIDTYMYKCARVFVTLPFMAEQRAGHSLIENQHVAYAQLFDVSEKKLKQQVSTIQNIIRKQ